MEEKPTGKPGRPKQKRDTSYGEGQYLCEGKHAVNLAYRKKPRSQFTSN